MKQVSKISIGVLVLFISISLQACNDSKSTNVGMTNVNAVDVTQTSVVQDNSGTGGLLNKLEEAKKAGKAVFLVVTSTTASNTAQAVAIAKQANKSYKNSVVLQMNRDDASNANLVNKFRISGAPVPLIIVISPKGLPVGGYPLNQATANNLVSLIPSPKLDEVYSYLNEAKPVFLIVGKSTYTDRDNLIANCKKAVSKLQNKAGIVILDLTDDKETKFIKQLNVNMTPNISSVVVINKQGQNTGVYSSNIQVSQLVLAAKKVPQSSCCPGGSGSCGPKK